MKKIFALAFVFNLLIQFQSQTVIKTDVEHFWIAYDSIAKIDTNKKELFKKLYIDKGSEGLKSFTKIKKFNENNYIESFSKFPKFWNTIRQNTFISDEKLKKVNKSLKNFSKLYPNNSKGSIYYTIGALVSGGTADKENLILGLEIVTGNKNTETSELENKFLKTLFKNAVKHQLEHVTVHEFVHTFQKNGSNDVLSKSIQEGSCDFIAELSTKKNYTSSYKNFGYKNYEKVKADFKKEMFTQNFENWVFNGGKVENPDLGYFVGYEISKKFYENSNDKKQAIKEIIELDFGDENAVLDFLAKSKYLGENIDIDQLKIDFKNNQPKIVKIIEFENGNQNVNPNLKKIQIVFSKPMNDKVSINFSKNGKEHFPLKNIVGFNEDKTILTLETIDLNPNTEYDFYVTNRGTKSLEGYPFSESEYKISFKTTR